MSVLGVAAMEFLRPSTWSEALQAKAEHPNALVIAGGTDVMVELNLGSHRPSALLDLSDVRELTGWSCNASDAGAADAGPADGGPAGVRCVRLGAGVTYARVVNELADLLPGLAAASRTVGSPQIRNRGTIGGNLGSASPAGDAHPPLLAAGAVVEIVSVAGARTVPVADFFSGPKRSVLAPDELIAGVQVPVVPGPQVFAKVGGRNAMVIAVCSFALSLDPLRRQVGTGIGSAAPTPRRAEAAEQLLAGWLEDAGAWQLPWRPPVAPPAEIVGEFGGLVSQAAAPIDDVRGSADYRRHALAVLARRSVGWACGPSAWGASA